ncbi:MAG: RagB/SusD family nutrient uptake outer membrane protein [Bacteroidetes bacterium]|nr:RagB/SusD family nutrient uptake outer membrane protein [Bacteroidota bacterium]
MNKRTLSYIGILFLVVLAACKKNYTDPSGPSSSQAFSSPNALTDVAVGLQNWYSAGRGGLVYNTIVADGLLTNQLYCVNAGNTDEAQLGSGGAAVLNTNGIGTGIWSVCNKIIFDADSVIGQTPRVVKDNGYASGLIAYTSIFKALAIADMATFWDHVPNGVADTLGVSNVGFVTSQQGYQNALAVINNALSVVNANPISASFLANTPNSVDIVNTLYALKARYSLMAGQYSDALTAAQQVNRSVRSFFKYDKVVTNPIFTLATSTNNIFQPIDSTMGLPVGLQPDAGDKREPFYIAISSALPRYRLNGFFNATDGPIPVYLPGEVMLDMAECYTRQGDLVNGANWLDSVVLKTTAKDAFGVGAGLSTPVTYTGQDDLLNQIYKHRAIELFMGGLRLADQRRFGRPVAERKRTWLPYPFVERNGNPNTPADPGF